MAVCCAPRIKSLYGRFKIPLPSKKDLKNEAKLAKGSMVLLKRKLQREQVCRDPLFQSLMVMVFGDRDDEEKLTFQELCFSVIAYFKETTCIIS